jgi:hypothetical protein
VSKTAINISYAQSLLWIALFIAVIFGVANMVELVFVDFIHGNPHRPQSNAVFMMAAYTPMLGVIAIIGSLLVFTLPQVFQVQLIGALVRRFGERARFAALFALPFTAVLTWYCYDYLTPTITDGYEHGISLVRYLKTVGFQALVTLFGFLYFNAGFRGRSRKPVVLVGLAIAIASGAIWGYLQARQQYQFL